MRKFGRDGYENQNESHTSVTKEKAFGFLLHAFFFRVDVLKYSDIV